MPDLIEVGLAAAKAFAIVMFAMNLAVLLTWADRRQGAVIQDRVGPNRAVAWIPTKVAMALAVLPALVVAAALPAWVKFNPELRSESIGMSSLLVSQLAIFMVWFTALVIAGKVRGRGARNSFDAFLAGFGDPRRIFYAGVCRPRRGARARRVLPPHGAG